MDLSFLKNVEVKDVAVKAKAQRITLEKTPIEGADFRVYKNGRIFTQPTTANKYTLEFGPKTSIVVPGKESSEDTTKEITSGNGLDIFSSKNWQMIAVEKELLFVGIIAREGNPKIDVYGSTTYDENGDNKRSIDNNTVSSFGKDVLVPYLEEIYGIDWDQTEFVDLKIEEDYQILANEVNGDRVYSIPKTVSRGDNKGELTYVTRKNALVFPLVVFEGIQEVEGNQVDLEDSIEEVEKETSSASDATDPVDTTDDQGEPSIHNNFKKKGS